MQFEATTQKGVTIAGKTMLEYSGANIIQYRPTLENNSS